MLSKDNKITERLGINRRNFIKLVVGGAIGTALSPLPWKLTDDLAIFTQNLPWVPVPPKGEFSYTKSLCTLCPGGCGIKVRKVDERAVKIEGRTDYPVNPGGICPLGAGGLQLLYNEGTRFTGPMKRVDERGTGSFEAISWDEAIDILAERISGLKAGGNSNALAAIDGNLKGSTMSVIIERFLNALGSSNYMKMQSSQDTMDIAANLLMGTRGPVGYDLENSDFILSLGSGLLEGWGSPARVINAWSLWRSDESKSRVKVVQVEPRASNTASRADKWLPAIPGTETALILGMAHVIIKEGLYNRDFIDNYSFGFYDFETAYGTYRRGFKTLVLEDYSPERVAEITGLEANEIESTARDFAAAAAPVAVCGRGKGALYGSLYESMAVLALNTLVGGINRIGGIFINEPLPMSALPGIQPETSAGSGLENERIDMAGSSSYPFSQSLFNNLADSVLNGNESPIDTLLVFSANPAFTMPNCVSFRKALEKIPFIVSFSPFRDETSLMADLILPDHIYLEKTDDIIWPSGLQYPLFGLSAAAVKPLYDTRNAGDVVIDLAGKIGGTAGDAFPWTDFEEVLKYRVKGLYDAGDGLTDFDGGMPPWGTSGNITLPGYSNFDEMWEKLKENGLWYRPLDQGREIETLFKTTSGRFEFFSSIIESALKDVNASILGKKASNDEICMPHFEDTSPDKDDSFPLIMYPYELINLASGWIPNPPYLNKTLFDDQLKNDLSFVDINPDTAAEYDLVQGDGIIIESPRGRIQALVNLFEGAMPGIVFMPLGLGHSAYDDFLRGKGANPNEIIHGKIDPLSGQNIWWNTPVRVTKL